MKKSRVGYVKNLLLPCLSFSVIAGAMTAVIIFVFKSLASAVTSLSASVYGFLRENPLYLVLAVLGFGLIGALAALVLKLAPDCRGGGIPTAVAVLRGFIPIKWIKSVIFMPICALISFFCGVPLGNEGPCVQMGTAVGNGTVRIFGKGKRAWSRYIMTGGACAGFAVATGAPITGVLFAVEEAHRRFSPLLFITASVSVTVSTAVSELIGTLTNTKTNMFDFKLDCDLPLRYIWVALIIGLVCGICAIFFTRLYRLCSKLVKNVLEKLPSVLIFFIIFAIVAIMGFVSADFIGSGHSLIEKLLDGEGIWYILVGCFCIRALLLMLANNAGVTGGLFVPTLTFGAILGALCGKCMVSSGLVGEEYFSVMVVIGMTAFLGASSRTPITACTFAIEALGGIGSVLPITAGVTLAYLVIETVGVQSFNDAVIDSKLEDRNRGRDMQVFDVRFTVQEKAFAVEKEIRDILWPPTCVVLSVEKNPTTSAMAGLSAGDVLHVHYSTCYPEETYAELEMLVGEQSEKVRSKVHAVGKNHQVPEL